MWASTSSKPTFKQRVSRVKQSVSQRKEKEREDRERARKKE